MKKIFIVSGRYIPGYKDGGPVRSIKNLVDCLGDDYDITIMAQDRDHGDTKPYDGINVGKPNKVGKATVYYIPEGNYPFDLMIKIANESDLVYLCGCFSMYAIRPLLYKFLGKITTNVVVASMGNFAENALKRKSAKKELFIKVFNALGIFKDIYWSVSSKAELEDVSKCVNTPKENFYIAEDLPRLIESDFSKKEKSDNTLKVFWISRIISNKNLKDTILSLSKTKSNIEFTIYGPVYDDVYWQECNVLLQGLPSNVSWKYEGYVESEQIMQTVEKHHVFLFLTEFENFGHVIYESLGSGCPVVLSNQIAFWSNLEKENGGYIVDSKDYESIAKIIDDYAYMDEDTFNKCAKDAYDYALRVYEKSVGNTGYKTIFEELSKC